MEIRRIYTHALNTQRYGERADGTTYERVLVIFPEDVIEMLKERIQELKEDNAKYPLGDEYYKGYNDALNVVLTQLEGVLGGAQ